MLQLRGIENHTLSFEISSGPIKFRVLDIPGSNHSALIGFEAARVMYDAAIVMYDVTSKTSAKNANFWISIVKTHTRGPIVICENKVDIENAEVSCHDSFGEQLISISAKSNYNFEKPFLYLARKLKDDSDLEFISKPAIQSPTIKLSQEMKLLLEGDQDIANIIGNDEQSAKTHQDLQQAIIAYAQLRQYGSGSVIPEIIRLVLDTLEQ